VPEKQFSPSPRRRVLLLLILHPISKEVPMRVSKILALSAIDLPMPVNVIYTTSAIAVGGRDGNSGTADGRFEANLARPNELGGKGNGNNPEQLFASAYAACFLCSMQLSASQGGPMVPANAEVMATVGLGRALRAALASRLPSTSRSPASAEARRRR
jgi:lipoyl-dependent peroxiredoxin